MAQPRPGIFGQTQFAISALINSAASIYNGKKTREQQEKLAEKNRLLTEKMEANRQNFQLEMHERNAEMQKQLSLQNHQLRLEEQANNFNLTCQQAEWNRFLSTWPLVTPPSVIRRDQILPDGTVALRVVFSKSNRNNNEAFAKIIYPEVEQGLREFVQLYHNQFQSKNLIFYHNGYSSNYTGDAIASNLYDALKELPVIIFECETYTNRIVISCNIWGFGSSERCDFTAFKIPYQQFMVNGKIDYWKLTVKILSYLKFLLGYLYDAYSLIEHNRAPLLPKVAAFEFESKDSLEVLAPMLDDSDVKAVFSEKYDELYDSVIGPEKGTFAQLPESCKSASLHELRLDYAEAVKECVSNAQHIKYLNDSLRAWVSLRSSAKPDLFLKQLSSGSLPLNKYCTKKDSAFLSRMRNLYTAETEYVPYLIQICNKLDSEKFSSKGYILSPTERLQERQDSIVTSGNSISPASIQSDIDTVLVFGGRAAGKTTYLASMYNAMHSGMNGISLSANNLEQHKQLQSIHQKLFDRNNRVWPMVSLEPQVYPFTVKKEGKELTQFQWVEYPTDALDPCFGMADVIEQQCSKATCLIVLIDGKSFCNSHAQSPEEYAHDVRRNLLVNRDLEIIRFLCKLGAKDLIIPPIGLVITKSDLIDDRWIPYLPEIIIENFAPLFGPGIEDDRIVMMAAVTLGNDIQFGGYANPIDLEVPIAFASICTLAKKVLYIRYVLDKIEADRQKIQMTHNDLFESGIFGMGYVEGLMRKSKLNEQYHKLKSIAQGLEFNTRDILQLFPLKKPIYVNCKQVPLHLYFERLIRDI